MGRLRAFLGEDLFNPSELEAKGEIQNVEREVTAKNGALRTILIHLKRVSIRDSKLLCTCRDVTELKETERQLALARLELAQAGRLALVTELTASIVHEIQQPLTAISANAEAGKLHLAKLPDGIASELNEILLEIQDSTGSAADIVDRLRHVAASGPWNRSPWISISW